MVVVFLAEGFEEVEAGPCGVMRRAGLTVKLAGVTGERVTGSHGICVQTDLPRKRWTFPHWRPWCCPAACPAPTTWRLPLRCRLYRQLRGAGQAGGRHLRGASILAHKGLLAGKNATAFPSFQKDLQEGGALLSESYVVRDGQFLTARGMGVATSLAWPWLPRWCRRKRLRRSALHPVGGVMEKKAPLRRELLARRDALPGRAEKSRAIQSRVLALPEYQRARRVLLYLSKGSRGGHLAPAGPRLAQGKEVYAPRCLERPGEMAFYRVSSREDLQAGAFGLLEPIPGRCPP